MDLDEATKAMAHGYELLSQLQKVGAWSTPRDANTFR